MKAFASPHRSVRALAGAAMAIALACVPGCKPAAPPPAPPPKTSAATTAVKTNSPVAQTNDPEQFVSVFNDFLSPDNGKDPFYPLSTRRLLKPVVPQVTNGNVVVHVEPALVLKGASPGRFALINGSVLELGEERKVRVPNGRITVKLLEIGDDYVIVKVAGEAEPKKLMLERKKSYHENHH
jgi:hypothetical protein